MESTQDLPAGLPSTSSVNRLGNLRQLLAQDVAALSSTRTETESCENSTTVLILMLILESITANTFNGDVIELSIFRAKNRCEALGINLDTFEVVVTKFVAVAKALRGRNPLAF